MKNQEEFNRRYAKLNPEQKQAVDTIEDQLWLWQGHGKD